MTKATHATTATLAAALSDATAAGTRVIVKRYGADATPAAVRTALAVSRVINDDAPRPTAGGNAVKVNAIIGALTGDTYATPADALAALREASAGGNAYDDAALMASVLAVSASLAAAATARREAAAAERAAIKAAENDRGASVESRIAAAAARLQGDADATAAAARVKGERAAAALAAAVHAGIAPDVLAALIVGALGATPAAALAAALPAAIETHGGI